MTHSSSLFSSNLHIRHSHHLQPDNTTFASSQPPTSFGRSNGFLKKIPSVLFNKEKTPIKSRSSKNKLNFYVDPSSPKPMKSTFSSTIQPPTSTINTIPTIAGENDKKTKKSRKALVDLFGWGNHHHHNNVQPVSPVPEKSVYAPAVPPKDNPAMLKKLNRPPSTKSTNSHLGSLRPPVLPAVVSRPSIGDDPFVRSGQGAEVVEHVYRHGAQTPSAKSIALDRRASVSSSKAMSYKTVCSDVHSTKEVTERTQPNVPKNTIEQRRVSAPLTQAPLVDLPPRSASLGKLFGTTMAAPLPQLPESPIEAEELPVKTLKKERTKSRVWGLLGRNKSKKEKVKVESNGNVPTLPAKEPWAQSMVPPPTGSSLSAHIDEKYAAAAIKSNVGSMRSTKQRRPPVLHISAPSTDAGVPVAPATASTMSFPHSANRSTFEDHDASPNSTPSKYPVSSGRGGVWESVVGTSATRTSDEDPSLAIEALMGPARLPKRKSLTGLFGVTVKRSLERIKPSSPPRSHASLFHHRVDASPPRIAAEPTLRSLAEEIEEASEPFKNAIVPSDKFVSRFSDEIKPAEKKEEILRRDPSLRRVASATDKLFTLVSCLDFSPASSNSPTLHHMGSLNSLRKGLNGSPTPVRRVRSAMLTTKASGSSLKPPSVNVSPLKFALHRAQAAANHKIIPNPVSPPRESLVRKGMRNIFSPPSPSPVPPRHGKPSKSVEDVTAAKVTDELVGMGQTMGPNIVEDRTQSIKGSIASDVPADLKAFFNYTAIHEAASSPGETTVLGLPAPPPKDRIPVRRPGPAPPALSLPPVPDMPLAHDDFLPHHIETGLDVTDEHDFRDSILEDMHSVGNNDHRNTFDFTSEYAALDQGTPRASFVEALKKVNSVQMFLPAAPPLPTLPTDDSLAKSVAEAIPSFHISKPSDSTSVHEGSEDGDEDDEAEYGDDEGLEHSAVIGRVTGFAKTSPVRREPFKGQFAFQQHVATMPRQESHASFGAPEPVLALPDVAPTHGRRRGHHRGESGLSIATMSSIGSVIGTGSEREYTNYFEVNFTNQHGHSRHQSITETIHEASDENSPKRVTSQTSLSSVNQMGARPTTRRGHHRRNSSIVSVDSLSETIGHNFSIGPPISSRNSRYGYISKHRRNASGESTFGRPDWAAHRRNSSSMSTTSNFSISQIVRPGLGDRMFQLDGGVQLTSITGSPPDEQSESRHTRKSSWDSLFDGTQSKIEDSLFDNSHHQTRDSIFDSDTSFNRSSADGDSLFGPEQSSPKKNFFLKELRPISTVSTATNGSNGDDTFQHVQKYMQNVVTPVKAMAKEIEACLQADGENMSNMTPLGKMKTRRNTIRQMLGSSISRPQRPDRRRPAHLILTEPPLDTPGLTSPSASETSSRLSLDTNAASINLGRRTRPTGAGHYRQKSSAGVNVDATIHEMPSMATLRANKSSASPRPRGQVSREPTIVGVDDLGKQDEFDRMRSVRNWVEWEREAVDEFRKTKNCWRDSEESKHALEDWKMPTTTEEIAAFLAQSTQSYKPLDQLPLGKIAHRRKSSLSDSRGLCSPYGLPLPKPNQVINKPKMSLTTKYEKKNSTSSTISASSAFAFAFPFPEDVPEAPPVPAQPIPAVFAQIVNDTDTHTPPSPPKAAPAFNFNLPSARMTTSTVDHFGIKYILESDTSTKEESEKKRNRVTSTARRAALGWGRRRNSDGPEKTIGLGYRGEVVMPNSAVPLQMRDTNLASRSNGMDMEKGSSNKKKKINVFDETLPSEGTKKNLFTVRDQENTNTTSKVSTKMNVKTRSPVKKRTLRQVVSTPRTLRV
ncbi:hypothetical protein I302_107471 [Kwoniella bestiolae CBS 10118]|uniref:Uncharacterized protein n=1 Tax=Kwoniella bestiolae CBS 10118 TaxID=1296100 RepID=A0A1B9FYG1_9TREE|nr:hypothetical protein I302_06788 [Kwoniella bestiolae CBS 10118]OCF23804.1 hypothetical protein I302_06788 [Kwoniella bestiolae CBS 10118]